MNASILVVAGSDTTATTVMAALYFLLTNSNAYQRLLTEVRSAFQSKAGITVTAVKKLGYTRACLNETM
jgi:cytochrome P450